MRIIRKILFLSLALLCFSLLKQNAMAEEKPDILFDGRHWKIGYEAHDDTQAITEYVLEGQTVENWSELVTAHRFKGLQNNIGMKAFMEIMQKDLYKTCPSARWEIISESPEDLIYAWQLENCPGQDYQYEIARLVPGREALHLVRYTHKAAVVDAERYEVWLTLLKSIQLKTHDPLENSDFSGESSLTENTRPAGDHE